MIFFVTSFGNDFWWDWASMLDPCWHPFGIKFRVFGVVVFLMVLLINCWSTFDQKRIQQVRDGTPRFRDLLAHTSTFYIGKTYKCQKPHFPIFLKIYKEFLHTCTFDLGKTYKCTVTVFTVFVSFSTLFRRWRFWKILGSVWCPLTSLLVPFWLHAVRLGNPFRSILKLWT